MASHTYPSPDDIADVGAAPSCGHVSEETEFHAGERICPAGEHGRRRSALRTLMFAAAVCGCAVAWTQVPEAAQEWLAFKLQAALSTSHPATEPPALDADAAAAPPSPLDEREVVAAPEIAGTPVPSATSEAATPTSDEETASIDSAEPQPLPPPAVDPADPNQKRAVAAGLHPRLSKVLLARLTDQDWRNAATAVETALKSAPDGEALAYPRNARGVKQALFEVHFVQGTVPTCRRYVVTVTLDRWSTTAPPMEKCGIKAPVRAVRAGVE